MASRSNSYKMKASTMDKREKRVLRVHRRSIDQREMRLDEVNKRRNLDNLTPVLESKNGSKQTSRIGTPSTSNQKEALSRLDKLKKWKEERELRKKLASMENARNKPGFKISHLSHQDNVLYKKDTSSSSKPSQSNGKPQRVVQPKPHQPASIKKSESKPVSTTKSVFVRKLTDSVKQPEPAKVEATVKKPELISKRAISTKLSCNTQPVRKNVSSPKTLKKLPSKEKVNPPRGGRAHFMAPTAASKSRATNAKNEKPKLATDTKKPAKDEGVPQSSAIVSTHPGSLIEVGEPSFAPSDFIFEAPSSIPSFVFKPLSPASAAGFLFPNSNVSSTTFSAFNNDVGRTSTPKKISTSVPTFQQERGEGRDEIMAPTTNRICENEVARQDTLQTEEQTDESNAYKEAKSPTIVTSDHRLTTCNKNLDFPDEANIKELSAIRRETFDKAVGELPMSTENKAAMQLPAAALTSDSGMGLSANDPETDSPVLKVADSSADEENNEVFLADEGAAINDAISLKSAIKQLADVKKEEKTTEHYSVDSSEEHSKESNNQFPAAEKSSFSLPVSDTEMRTTRSRSRSFGALRPSSKKDLIFDESFKPSDDGSLCSRRSVARVSKLERSVEDNEKENRLVQSVFVEGTNALDTRQYENQQPSTEVTAVLEELLDPEVNISGKQSKKQQLVLDQANISIMRKTPLRRSSRLVARAETESTDEQNGATNEKESTPLLRLHRSHRSSVPNLFLDSKVDTSHIETHKNATPIGKSRRSKRLSAAVVESPIPSVMKELPAEHTPSKSVAATIGEMSTPQCSNTEMEINEEIDKGCSSGYENDGVKSAYQLRRRRNTTFLTPGVPLSSVKRSKAKRRRTDIMIALASAKSPEEVIKIIATSPMVEMTRRTPKSKLSPEMKSNSTAALFDDDDDMLLQGPLQLFPDPVDAQKPSCSSEENSKDKEHEDASVPEKRDVSFFRALWATEVEQLTKLADKWEALGEGISGLCEEVQGEIRSTVCQARLLMKQKLQQFSGLVDSCESGDPRTTCQDLQGFWDMVYMQVEDVDNKFRGLDKLQQNNWKPEEVDFKQGKNAIKGKKPARVVKASGKSKAMSKFAAFKTQLLKQNKAADAEIVEEKVFDAGFFKVSSPVRTPRHHCEAGTPTKVELPILQSTGDKSSQELTPSSSKQTDSRLSAASENKENVAHIFLRRSMGEGHPRRSFSQSVPSPLLKDSTPRRKSVESSSKQLRRSLYQRRSQGEDKSSEKDESSEDSLKSHVGDEGRALPVRYRRSTRKCKSVSFVESESTQSDPVDFMAYLQPSFVTASDSPQQVSSLDSSPFSVDSLLVQEDNSVRNTPASRALSCTPSGLVSGGRQRSCLKKLPSVERRKSRRSVSFVASPSLSENRSAFPSTPYNRNSLVANTRILRQSAAHDSPQIESTLNELQDLKQMPKLRRSTRPSLLYTPPQQKGSSQKTPVKDIPVDTLVAFTP